MGVDWRPTPDSPPAPPPTPPVPVPPPAPPPAPPPPYEPISPYGPTPYPVPPLPAAPALGTKIMTPDGEKILTSEGYKLVTPQLEKRYPSSALIGTKIMTPEGAKIMTSEGYRLISPEIPELTRVEYGAEADVTPDLVEGITITLTDTERQELARKQEQATCAADAQKYEPTIYKVTLMSGGYIFVEAPRGDKGAAKERAIEAGYDVRRVTWSHEYGEATGAERVERQGGLVKLSTGEWVKEELYDSLSNDLQAKLNTLGVDKYNQWLVDETGKQIATSGSQYLIGAFESGGVDGYNKAVEEYNKTISDVGFLNLYTLYKKDADKEWGRTRWEWFQETYADKLKDTKYMEYIQSPEFKDRYASVIQPSTISVADYNLIKPYITPEGFDSDAAYRAGENNPILAANIIRITNEFTLATLGDETKAKINSGEWLLLPYGQIIDTENLERMPPTYRNLVENSGLVGLEAYQEKVDEWNKSEGRFKNTIDAISANVLRLGGDIKNFALLELSAGLGKVKEGDPKPVIDPSILEAASVGYVGFTPPVVTTYTAEEAAELNAARAKAQSYYKDIYDEAELAAQEWLASRPYLQPVYPAGFVDSVKEDPSALFDPLLWTETIAATLPYTVATGLVVGGAMAGGAGMAVAAPLAFSITLSVEGHDIYKDAIANGASHDRALRLANTYGSISASIETLGDCIFVGVFGIGAGAFSSHLGKNMGGNIVRGAAKKYGWKNLTVGMIKDFVNQGGQEFFQEVVHNAAIKTVNQNQALLDNTLNAFVSGIIGTAPFVLFPAGGQAIRNLETRISDIRAGKAGALTPIDITPQMQLKILDKVFAPVSGFTVKTTEAEIAHFKKFAPEMLKGGPVEYLLKLWELRGRNIYEADKSITVGLIDKKTVITDKTSGREQVIPPAERGRLATSLAREAKGLRKIADGIIDELNEINRKPNKTKADLDRKAELDTKLNELESQISELARAISDIDNGVVTPLVAKFYPDLAKTTKGKSKVDETALAYAEAMVKVNEYAVTQLKLKQAQQAIAKFGLAKSGDIVIKDESTGKSYSLKSYLKQHPNFSKLYDEQGLDAVIAELEKDKNLAVSTTGELGVLDIYKTRAEELEARLKELEKPMVEAVKKFSEVYLKNSSKAGDVWISGAGGEINVGKEVRAMAKTIAMDIDSVTSQLFGERNALAIGKDIKELKEQIKVIEDEISKGMTRGQIEGYARLIGILKGQVGDLVNELRIRYLAEGEKINPDTKRLTMEAMSLQARLVKAVENLNNFAGSALDYDVYRKGELAHEAEVVKLERDTFEAIQKTTEAIWGRESYASVLEQLNRVLGDIISSMENLESQKTATKAAFKIYDAIKKQDVKLLTEGVKILQLEAGKIKDKPLQLQAGQQVKLLETLTMENFWNRFKETKPKEKADFAWYKSDAFKDDQSAGIMREAERIVQRRYGELIKWIPDYVQKRGSEEIMAYLNRHYDKAYFEDMYQGEFEDVYDFLDVQREADRIYQEVARQEDIQRRGISLEIQERERNLAKELGDKATSPVRKKTLDNHAAELERSITEQKRELKVATKIKLVIPAEKMIEATKTAEERGVALEPAEKVKEEDKVSSEERAKAEAKAAQRIRIAKKQIMEEELAKKEKVSAFPGITPKIKTEGWTITDYRTMTVYIINEDGSITKIDPVTQVKTTTKLEPQIAVSPAIREAVKVGLKEALQTATLTKTQTQTAVQTAVQTALELSTETATEEQIKTATKIITEVVTKTVTRRPTMTPPPIIPTLSAVRKAYKEGIPILVWKQGELKGGEVWKVVINPERQAGLMTVIGTANLPVPHRKVASGKGSAKATVQWLGKGPTYAGSADLGIMDVYWDRAGENLRFESGGLETDVGQRMPSPTKGISIEGTAGISPETEGTLVPKPKSRQVKKAKKSKRLTSYEYATTLKGFDPYTGAGV